MLGLIDGGVVEKHVLAVELPAAHTAVTPRRYATQRLLTLLRLLMRPNDAPEARANGTQRLTWRHRLMCKFATLNANVAQRLTAQAARSWGLS